MCRKISLLPCKYISIISLPHNKICSKPSLILFKKSNPKPEFKHPVQLLPHFPPLTPTITQLFIHNYKPAYTPTLTSSTLLFFTTTNFARSLAAVPPKHSRKKLAAARVELKTGVRLRGALTKALERSYVFFSPSRGGGVRRASLG